MAFFILISSPVEDIYGKSISAYHIAEQRVKAGFWPMYKGTSNRTHIREMDRALVYLSGYQKGAKSFYCSLEIEAIDHHVKHVPEQEKNLILNKPFTLLKFSSIEIFPEPLAIKPILRNLELIKDESKWGKYLQGGAKSLSERDYELIRKSGLR